MDCPPDAAAEGNRRSLRTPAVGRRTRLPREDVPGVGPRPSVAGARRLHAVPGGASARAHGVAVPAQGPHSYLRARAGEFQKESRPEDLERSPPGRRVAYFTGSRVE